MVRDVASSGPTIAIPESSEIANLAVVERDDRIVFPLMDIAKPFHSTKWLLLSLLRPRGLDRPETVTALPSIATSQLCL